MISPVAWRLVGLVRDAPTNRAYLQVQRHPGEPFDSIELDEDKLLELTVDAASTLQTLWTNPPPPPPFVETSDG